MPGRKRVTKFDRCLRDVKRKGVRSPGAVCQKSVGRGNPSDAYKAGFAALRAGEQRHGTVNLSPSIAQREDWAHAWREFMAGWNAAKKRGNKGHRPRTKKKVAKRNPAKRNPEALAVEAYREFHGKDPAKVITVDTPRHYHGVLAGIGKLDFVTFHRPEGKAKGIKFTAGTYLAENEKRTQLFITGGDQSVNLRDFGISKPHESEILGEVSEIGYRTEKLHLIEKDGGKGLYVHKFGTPRPTLIYDTRNKVLSFAGGGYTIPSEGIDG